MTRVGLQTLYVSCAPVLALLTLSRQQWPLSIGWMLNKATGVQKAFAPLLKLEVQDRGASTDWFWQEPSPMLQTSDMVGRAS